MTADWRDDAACIDYPSQLGLWDGTDPRYHLPELAIALPVCWVLCPVREHCGQFGTKTEIEDGSGSAYGIWGGLTPVERHGGGAPGRVPDSRARSRHTACVSDGCTGRALAGTRQPYCSEHLVQVRGWDVTPPEDLPPSLFARARERAASNRLKARAPIKRRAPKAAPSSHMPSPRRAADDLTAVTEEP